MRHDSLCERDSPLVISGSFGPSRGCKCASRAYARNPLPNDWIPVWAIQKTPGQEGG